MSNSHFLKILGIKAGLILALGTVFISCKRDKLVESSIKGRPVWVYGIERNYIIVEGRGRSHDEARQKAFTALKESIVNAVSVNVSSTVQMDISEEVINTVRLFKENLKVNTTVTSDFLRSLRGVQLSKATDWYWELRRTPEKERYVVYHVKYPFTENELETYIREWESLDAELANELNSLAEKVEKSKNISELLLLKTEAERLARIFKEPRRTMALNTASRIAQKLDDTRLEVIEHQRGQVLVALRSNGTHLRNSDVLRFDSRCAAIESQQYLEEDGLHLIHYDVAYCSQAEESLTLSTSINGRQLTVSTAIPADPAHVGLSIQGQLQLYRLQGHLHEWRLPVRLLSDESIEITNIEISLERTAGRFLASLSRKGRAGLYTLIQEPLQDTLTGKGDHLLSFEAAKLSNEADDIFSALFEDSATYEASGKINYRRNGSDESRSYRFERLPVSIR
jgi:hypothetical protein